MASFPSAATSVFQGMTAPLWASIQSLPRPLPKFRLVPTSRNADVEASLSTVVADEVIPRLALAYPFAKEPEPALKRASPSPQAFARTLLERDGDAAGAIVQEAIRHGAEPKSLYDDVLAPTAFLLADMWRDDRLSYSEVTIGLTRLQRIVHDLPRETAYNGENNDQASAALFAPRPGEQQTFGFYMIEERFRWGGWRTWIETTSTREGLVANARCRWFDMVCLSVSRSDGLGELTDLVAAIRRGSRNRDVVIAMDGAFFADDADQASSVGADAVISRGGDVLRVVSGDALLVASA